MKTALSLLLVLLGIMAVVAGCVLIAGRHNSYAPHDEIAGTNRVTKIEVKPH